MKRSEQQEKAQKFLDIEVENNLFDLVDKNGVRVWDVVRFNVGNDIIWNFKDAGNIRSKKTFRLIIERVLILLKSISFFLKRCKKYKTLSIVGSRNILNGNNFDLNIHDAINLLEDKETLVLENIPVFQTVYKNSYNLNYLLKIYGLFISTDYIYYDYTVIVKLIQKTFPYIKVDDSSLNLSLKQYYLERKLYNFILKKHAIQQVLYTRGAIMKGLFTAASDLNVKTFEFQHGIVNEKHFMYSYPKGVNVESKSYQPDKIFALSDYWFSTFYCPIEKVTIGNNYFAKEIDKKEIDNTQTLLVISSKLIGVDVSNCLVDILDNIPNWTVYYKLHPNEFDNIEYYENKFKRYNNVQIISNQSTVNDLLSESLVLLTSQSTAIYEALQCGIAVVIMDIGEYNEIQMNNVFHIKSGQELHVILNGEIKAADNITFFKKLDVKELKKHILL